MKTEKNNVYTMEQWTQDRTFKAEPGQEVEAAIYEQMLNCMPPKSLPRGKALYALESLNVPVHAGFLMGEPHSSNANGEQLYLAFGMNDYGSGTRREPHYFYLGLSIAEKPIADGFYYFFDCLNAMLTDRYFEAGAFKDDKDAISTAANYEATLYKYEFKDGDRVSSKVLYDPYGCYDEN